MEDYVVVVVVYIVVKCDDVGLMGYGFYVYLQTVVMVVVGNDLLFESVCRDGCCCG